MKRKSKTRTEIADILLQHIRRVPGGEHIRGIRIGPRTDVTVLPSFVIDVDAQAGDEANTAVDAIRRMIPILYEIYDVKNFAVH
ncbi:hypothetical protein [Methylobacterium nodulans]|uniref:MIP18 family-like domain-containing protein n=1 Tax=Methylobacterium nodulans (strain LMG 21967 / CNCM I-2342 / ORS 2060) TaxID=460265 RepID=B8IE62_METNO|nr:hypothetical protein [Methylobacterium nodulans]ACL57608.1 hypothetical protein Mnod_2645 [Methylobacterium nodulans ORS 2060]